MQVQTSSSPFRSRALSYQEIKVMASLILDEPDHYTVLGVDQKASLAEINESYCMAVKQFHPLNHGEAIRNDTVFHWLLSRAFTRLSTAYRVISNSRRREIYDRALNAGLAGVARAAQTASTPADFPMDDEEILKLQSYSFATPEWMAAKRKGKAVGHERRRVERVKMQIPVVITCEAGWQETGQTCDLSPLGALITLGRSVEPGTMLRLRLPMPRQFRTRHYNTEIYTIDARVLRTSKSKPTWEIAVEFI